MLRGYDKRKFIANPKACILPRGSTFGDRRYRYKNFWCLSVEEKRQVKQRYPHKVAGIPDGAYAYPIDKMGRLAKGRASRTLIWSHRHTISKVRR